MNKKTITITLDEDTAAALEAMHRQYGTLATFTSCASASLEVGLCYYAKLLKIPLSKRLQACADLDRRFAMQQVK